jgi:glutathione S-transferase
MKLFYSPGACSLAPHIVLRETAQAFTLERVDLRTHTTEHGKNYYDINPKGAVPVLEIGNADYLTEGPIICQYLADQAQNTDLLPAAGAIARYRVMEWQSYVTSELHKSYSVLFNPAFDTAAKDTMRSALRKKYEWVNARLAGRSYLTGNTFTCADAYLFTVTRWAKTVQLDLSGLDAVSHFNTLVSERPAVRAALDAEAGAKS